MSKIRRIHIIGRALTDAHFRERLFEDPASVSKELGLADKEARKLCQDLDLNKLRQEAIKIDRRSSRMIYTTTRV